MAEQATARPSFWQSIRADQPFQSVALQRWQPLYDRAFKSPWTIAFLLLVGVLRALFFLWGYPAAHGADNIDYYLYAAYIAGEDLPPQVANVSPLFPLFVWFNHYLLNNFHLVMLGQFVMSALLGVLMYLGLRRYNALLAFLVGLVVLGDAQVGVVFNLSATEPLYIFLLCLMYAAATATAPAAHAVWWVDFIIGITLVLLRETRTVARYLFAPVLVLYALYTRNWRRVLRVGLGFALVYVAFSFLSDTAQVRQVAATNEVQYLRPLLQNNLLDAANGAASRQLVDVREQCRTTQPDTPWIACATMQVMDEDAFNALVTAAYREAIAQNPTALLESSIQSFHRFLRLSGQQFSGGLTPATVQCDTLEARIERQRIALEDASDTRFTLTPQQLDTAMSVTEDFLRQLCPHTPQSSFAQEVSDWLALRYRSLSRPDPYRWNALIFLLIVALPWARRYWYPFLLAGSIWAYHAAVSAAVSNVQPRYVVVTNPMRAVLVVLLLFLVAKLLLHLFDALLLRRQSKA